MRLSIRTALCLVIASLAALPARAAVRTNALHASFYGHVEQFDWKELDDDDTELLKESGPLYGIGGVLGIDISKQWKIEALLEGFFGQVDYDGATQSGVPIKSTTDYAGARLEGTVSVGLPVSSSFSVSPFGGAGSRFWLRRINDSDDGRGFGYDEYWTTVYGIAGVGATMKLKARTSVFGKAAVHLPVDNEVRYDMSHVDGPSDVSVNPGESPSLRVEGGLGWENLTASVFYENMIFDKSNYATVGDVFIWQPKSEASFFGASLGVAF